jgi:hypothetical protein
MLYHFIPLGLAERPEPVSELVFEPVAQLVLVAFQMAQLVFEPVAQLVLVAFQMAQLVFEPVLLDLLVVVLLYYRPFKISPPLR